MAYSCLFMGYNDVGYVFTTSYSVIYDYVILYHKNMAYSYVSYETLQYNIELNNYLSKCSIYDIFSNDYGIVYKILQSYCQILPTTPPYSEMSLSEVSRPPSEISIAQTPSEISIKSYDFFSEKENLKHIIKDMNIIENNVKRYWKKWRRKTIISKIHDTIKASYITKLKMIRLEHKYLHLWKKNYIKTKRYKELEKLLKECIKRKNNRLLKNVFNTWMLEKREHVKKRRIKYVLNKWIHFKNQQIKEKRRQKKKEKRKHKRRSLKRRKKLIKKYGKLWLNKIKNNEKIAVHKIEKWYLEKVKYRENIYEIKLSIIKEETKFRTFVTCGMKKIVKDFIIFMHLLNNIIKSLDESICITKKTNKLLFKNDIAFIKKETLKPFVEYNIKVYLSKQLKINNKQIYSINNKSTFAEIKRGFQYIMKNIVTDMLCKMWRFPSKKEELFISNTFKLLNKNNFLTKKIKMNESIKEVLLIKHLKKIGMEIEVRMKKIIHDYNIWIIKRKKVYNIFKRYFDILHDKKYSKYYKKKYDNPSIYISKEILYKLNEINTRIWNIQDYSIIKKIY